MYIYYILVIITSHDFLIRRISGKKPAQRGNIILSWTRFQRRQGPPWCGGLGAAMSLGLQGRRLCEQGCHGAWWEEGQQSHFSLRCMCASLLLLRLVYRTVSSLSSPCVLTCSTHVFGWDLHWAEAGTWAGCKEGKKSSFIFTQSPSDPTNSYTIKKKKSAGKEIYEWTTGEGKGQKLLALTLLMIKLASNHSPTLSLSHLHFLMRRKG